MSFWFIRAIVFSVSTILTFRVSSYAIADALDSLSLLIVVLNYWEINDVACFTFDELVWPVAVEALRDLSQGG